RAGTRKRRSTAFPIRSSGLRTSRRPRSETRKVSGRRSSPPPCSLADPAPPHLARPTLPTHLNHPTHLTYPTYLTHPTYLACVACVVALLWPTAALSQVYESVGIRAQGMAGAFVAVADDASATWWNPAGLATGAYVSSIFEYETGQDPRRPTDATGLPVGA